MHSRNKLDDSFKPALRRLAGSAALSWVMMLMYTFTNHRPSPETVTVEMPSWVPFSPWFLAPYLGLLVVTVLLPVAVQTPHRYRSCLLAYGCAFLLVMPWWVLTPTMLPRPALPEGIWGPAFQWLWKIDKPYNVMPCAHAVGPIVAAWFASREYPAWRWPLGILLLLTLPSIALVWQHRPLDILLGAVAAAAGIAIAEVQAIRARLAAKQSGKNEMECRNGVITPSVMDV